MEGFILEVGVGAWTGQFSVGVGLEAPVLSCHTFTGV